jgi:fucose permease
MLGAGAIFISIVQARNLDAAVSVSLIAAGFIALALLVIQERRATEPIVPFWMWRSRIMTSGNIGSLVNGALLMCVVAFLPTYMQGVMGHSASVAGAIIATQSVSWSTGSIISGRVMAATSYRTSGVVGALALIAGTSLLISLDRNSSLPHLALAVLLIGLGMGFCNQTFLIAIQSSVGWSERGVATASTLFLRTFGQALGASLGGAILNFGLARVAADADQALNRLLEPASRTSLAPDALLRLSDAIAASLHDVYVIAGVLAMLALGATLVIPARVGPKRGP